MGAATDYLKATWESCWGVIRHMPPFNFPDIYHGVQNTVETVREINEGYRRYSRFKEALAKSLPWVLGLATAGGILLTFKDRIFKKPEPPVEGTVTAPTPAPIYASPPPPLVQTQWVERVGGETPAQTFAERTAVPIQSYTERTAAPASYTEAELQRGEEAAELTRPHP